MRSQCSVFLLGLTFVLQAAGANLAPFYVGQSSSVGASAVNDNKSNEGTNRQLRVMIGLQKRTSDDASSLPFSNTGRDEQISRRQLGTEKKTAKIPTKTDKKSKKSDKKSKKSKGGGYPAGDDYYNQASPAPSPGGCECVGYGPCYCDDDYHTDDGDDDKYQPTPSSPPTTNEYIRFVMVREEAGTPYAGDFTIGDSLALNGQIYFWKDYGSKVMDSVSSGNFVALCTAITVSDNLLCTYEILLSHVGGESGLGALISSGPNFKNKENALIVTGLAYDFAKYSGGSLVTTEDTVKPYLYATLSLH